jgi:hypothetical protein
MGDCALARRRGDGKNIVIARLHELIKNYREIAPICIILLQLN